MIALVLLMPHEFCDGPLQGGSKEDRLAAHEWISLFWYEAVIVEGNANT
jgi:hypothetical protein